MASLATGTKKSKGSDEFYTPLAVWKDFAKYVPEGSVIWEPFPGESDSVERMREAFPSCTVVGSQTDFFETPVPEGTTLIVSNPPYTIKPRIFARLRELGLPFAMLVPVGTHTKKYLTWAQGELQLVIPRRRIQFEVGGEPLKRCPFDTSFHLWGFGLAKDLNFL